MTAARLALARATGLLCRAAPSGVAAWAPRRLLHSMSVPVSATKALPRPAGALARSAPGRCFSAAGESPVPGSRIWTFDEVKTLVQERREDKEGSGVVIVDVREPAELLATGKIPGTINIPIASAVQSFHVADDFEAMYSFARPPRDATLLFYCKAGVRARSAASLARHAGWQSVGEYSGSWLDWEARGGPVNKVPEGEH